LDISNEERYTYYDAMPNTRILRSKLDWTLYTMRKENLIEATGLSTYIITDKGKRALFN
jgi:hypothetical protein